MRFFAGLIVATFVLASVPAVAAELPSSVTKDLAENAKTCADAGGKPATANAVKRADLNGDGKEDFVLDVGAIDCDGAASIFGDREKGVTVYAGDGAGSAVQAYSDSVYGVKIEGSTLWLTLSDPQCGRRSGADFASASFCERPVQWNAKAGKFELAPVSTIKMVQ
jgi:hypothetical protein